MGYLRSAAVVTAASAIAARGAVTMYGGVSAVRPIAVISEASKGGWIIATGRSGIGAAGAAQKA